ncbi:condensin subunit ScpB [Sanguibacter gelidistatuariae]|uniref:Condensin subunit ScpB n=1 Tax=Sanguibacter gelidistatuariae TaxID=1814289 RepID=A0A1G6T5B9_9MICO|nr:SMC-Scp complex subunit ScpB [Sanguibacter gelidistatuariae]SDD24258.1 condensin subunit ScpB [Sanguibacter gelidistatuariae]
MTEQLEEHETGHPAQAPTQPAGAADIDVDALPGGALAAIEAILMIAEAPVSAMRLAVALHLPLERVEDLLWRLSTEYSQATRPQGFELREAGGGWRFYSAAAFAGVVGLFVTDGQSARLSQAALETLAVIAYRQPVTRGQVSAVRGVSVDGVVRTLTMRGLVAEVGTEATSGATLYGTTGYFMERMGFTSLDELPALAPHLPEIDSEEMADDAQRRGLEERWAVPGPAEMAEQPDATKLEEKVDE